MVLVSLKEDDSTRGFSSFALIKNIAVKFGLFFFLYISLWQFIDGLLHQKIGLNISTFINLLPVCIGMAVLTYGEEKFLYRYSIILLVILLFLSAKNLGADVSLTMVLSDFQYMFRGIVVLILVSALFYALPTMNSVSFFYRFSNFQFWFVSGMVFLHLFFGIGGVEQQYADKLRDAYTSFFRHGNQIIALLTASWWVIFSQIKSLSGKTIVTAVMISVALLMGSKTAIVVAFVMLGISFTLWLRKKSKLIFIAWSCTIFILVTACIFYINEMLLFIAHQFVDISSEGDKLLRKIETTNVLSALMSSRDVYIGHAFSCLSQAGWNELFFGLGINNYTSCLGSNVDNLTHRFAENDAVDLLGSFGIVGLFSVYGSIILVCVLYLRKLKNRKYFLYPYDNQKKISVGVIGTLIIYILFSLLSGHVFLYPITSIAVGISLGIIFNHLRLFYFIDKHENELSKHYA